MGAKKDIAATYAAVGFTGLLIWWWYNKPCLTYQWVNGLLNFNLSKGSKSINGSVALSNTNLTDNVQWIGDLAFSVIAQADSVLFEINDAAGNIIFSQTVDKPTA